ncbi:membrane dipeptidase [Lachnospiraceae bacterium PF1-21]|uniref:Membrane dipeptidase n=1 Tax=Ohessyouella blattaphilus TaxID=2949333 RepID=A0ABT1EIZ8_9FIRM|nr:membrane dipeptidase [Ohessyouella blattaphilus]MCP1110680.1 membrane dipeptidase [Ohessyouella blattaphilus]MCR8564074.1 membrane dipeptidase [Ohessyouella blattaphilus]
MQLFDLHCDSLVKYLEYRSGFLCEKTQFSLKNKDYFRRMVQTMAVFVPDDIRGERALEYFKLHQKYLSQLLEREEGLVGFVSSSKDIVRVTGEGRCGILLAVESGAVLAGKLENVDYLARMGVRLMTLVWNGENEIGSGHQTDNGLSDFGRQVIKRMEEKKIIVDVSHLNDRGFAEVCEVANKPFVATHSNLRSVCSHKRNLTEKQFEEIVRREGLVGINLYERFLSNQGKGTIDQMYRHVSRMLELGGEDVIACGSDFDGADVNPELDSPVKFATSAEYLLQKGISQSVVNKMFFENALRFFARW